MYPQCDRADVDVVWIEASAPGSSSLSEISAHITRP